MRIKFHTVAAIVVLASAGFWVATGEFTSVGSQIGGASPAEAAEASAPAGDVAAAVGVRLAPTAEFVTIEITATDAAGAI